MLRICPGPVWRRDDFSHCVQTHVIQLLLPLLTCLGSFVVLLLQVGRRWVRRKRKDGYERWSNGDAFPDRAEADEAIEGSEDDDDDENYPSVGKPPGGIDRAPRPSQQTIDPKDQVIFEATKPKGEVALVVLETAAVGAEVVIHLLMLVKQVDGASARPSTIAGLATWLYIFVLVSVRLMFSAWPRDSHPRLWNHTAALYGLQWLFTVVLFRSAIIHPRSKLAQGLTIGDFVLVTILSFVVLTARKGNRCVVLEHDRGLEPSREPIANLLSRASFAWIDSLVWTGYKKNIKLPDIPDLASKDKAAAILKDFRQLKKTSKLAWHLLKYFRAQFLLQASWALFSSVFTFTPTLLLKVILEYVERPDDTPANAAWLYVVLLFVTGCIMALSDGQALWTGRKICVRLHSVIVGEVYAKALRRKVASGSDTVLGQGDANANVNQEGFLSRLKSCFRRKKSKPAPSSNAPATDVKSDTQANVGTIINLMAVDSFKVAEVSAYLHFLWASAPIEIILAVTLLYQVLGLSSVAGIGVMVILLPINIMIARGFSYFQKKIMAATDARIHVTNEVLQNIRIIKFFAWEQRFGQIVDEKRQVELRYLRNRYILWSLAATIWYGAPLIIAFFTFFIYTVIEQKKLIPSVAFTALSLFSILRVPLDQLADMLAHVQEAQVSVDRVEEFLNEEETEKYQQLKSTAHQDAETPIGLHHVTCTWGSREAVHKNENEAFTLSNIDVTFHRGELNIIAGPTGSGKTSLLMALLGEMTLLDGTVSLPGGFSREDLKPDPETGLIEAVAYCAQQAWLVNDTIRQNILFASPVDETRYKDVIRACALERDLEILNAGDQTQVGEKGIALSGGQKQRISLARALYSHTRHVLLDDCLSAVDSHTAKWIFDHGIMGPLMYHRTCILVTHNVALCVPQSQYVVYLDNGRVTAHGSPDEVIASGVLGEDLQKSQSASTANSRLQLRSQSIAPLAEDGLKVLAANGTANGSANGAVANGKKPVGSGEAVDDPDRTEGVAVGRVKWSIIQLFLTAMGPWYYWMAALGIFAAQQLSSVATNVWIREWANSYHDTESRHMKDTSLQPLTSLDQFRSLVTPGCIASGTCLRAIHLGSSGARFGKSSTGESRSEPNIRYYLTVYALLVMAYMLVSVTREGALFWGSLAASRRIHRRLVESLTRAKFSFFDSTPLGQIMNRFSKDVEAIDQEVAPIALSVLSCLASVITIVILISVITPGFLIAAVFITVVYISIGTFYIRSSRDLKRLESVQRSPLYQHFGETLTGITTIRAYGDERRFIRENLHRVNMHHRPFYFLWATNRWLAFRIDIAGALVSFFAGCFVVLNARKIDPGAAGLSLTYAVTFTENVLWLVRLYSVNEQNMNSVERIKEYLEVEQEAQAVIPETRPPSNWPSEGCVEFFDYTTRYRSDLDPVLRHVSFKIRPLEKVGIVGRTGAGKSSLALALFRGLEAEEGKILIDNVDIGSIGLQDLRESITIVPQDPTLFTGTIRSNLDPFGLFTDTEIFSALRRVRLIDSSGPSTRRPSTANTLTTTPPTPTTTRPSTPANKNIFLDLSSSVTESGNNLSQGQKQLLCLARAMLKEPRVILMDEATASIDYNTDAKIQETIRELQSTTITIAHRLQTIIDYDKVLLLEKGEVKEFDHPWILLQNEESVFRHMCEMSGEYDNLVEAAKKAWKTTQLVDLES